LLANSEDGRTASGAPFAHETDFVLLCTGFEADMGLFRKAGVTLSGAGQAPVLDPQTMETDVPGLFAAGTASAGTQERFRSFISTSHDHVARIVLAISGRNAERLGTVAGRNNAVTWEEVRAN
jgi:thioredoxin reductase (NADPH)